MKIICFIDQAARPVKIKPDSEYSQNEIDILSSLCCKLTASCSENIWEEVQHLTPEEKYRKLKSYLKQGIK